MTWKLSKSVRYTEGIPKIYTQDFKTKTPRFFMFLSVFWLKSAIFRWAQEDSNFRPSDYESPALTAAPWAR